MIVRDFSVVSSQTAVDPQQLSIPNRRNHLLEAPYRLAPVIGTEFTAGVAPYW